MSDGNNFDLHCVIGREILTVGADTIRPKSMLGRLERDGHGPFMVLSIFGDDEYGRDAELEVALDRDALVKLRDAINERLEGRS